MSDLPPRDRLAFPLDVPTLAEARAWIDRLAPAVGLFKVGLELFTAAGPDAVRAVHDAGAACFLDLKLDDIPATVASATGAASHLGVRYLTVHVQAGSRALEAAVQAAGDVKLLGVTVLTSLADEDLSEVGGTGPVAKLVGRRARVAQAAGLSGLVCSAAECASLRTQLGAETLLVVPGIRFEQPLTNDDQRRTATPEQAARDGADVLVVGRPIRNASNPVAAAGRVLAALTP